MTTFSSSQEGGPGVSQTPALTLSYGKQPRIWDSGRGVPVGSMETRDASGLVQSWQETQLRSCANRRRGKPLSPALQRRSATVPAAAPGRGLRSQLTDAGAKRGDSAESEQTAAEENARGRRRRRSPRPLPSLTAERRRNFEGTEETSLQSQGTPCLPSWGPLPSRPEFLGCFLRAAAGTRKTTAAAALAASLIRALGNNFPPRAPRPRKLLRHFRVVVSDALQRSSGRSEKGAGLDYCWRVRALLDQLRRWETGESFFWVTFWAWYFRPPGAPCSISAGPISERERIELGAPIIPVGSTLCSVGEGLKIPTYRLLPSQHLSPTWNLTSAPEVPLGKAKDTLYRYSV